MGAQDHPSPLPPIVNPLQERAARGAPTAPLAALGAARRALSFSFDPLGERHVQGGTAIYYPFRYLPPSRACSLPFRWGGRGHAGVEAPSARAEN